MADIRMYVQSGCPHCETARQFFTEKGVTVEVISIGFDPLLQSGIRAMSNGQGLPVPIIISYATQETIVGNDTAQLQRVADAVLSNRPNAPDTAFGAR